MRTEIEIKTRQTEIKGAIQHLLNLEALEMISCAEEYEALDSLIAERETLEWVLGDAP